MATPFDAKNPARFEVPVPPQEFGQDGGKFYHYYDTLADEIDDNMVAGLKEQLDGLLIFAGLFAGVNTAFLALTLPLMSPDPADDTNALLRDILFNLASGRNDSLSSANALPSETFSPDRKILTVNVLFSVSLTFALVSSFVAVLGRQWLVYYRKRTGGGPERRRWEQLKRFLGAERWRLEGVLDDVLPSLLQIGLIIFCISLTIYLNTLHPMLSNIVGAFMCAGLAILIVTAIFAIWDKFCPFQSPLSHFIRAAGLSIIALLRIILWPFCYIAVTFHYRFIYGSAFEDWPWYPRAPDGVKAVLDNYLTAPITSLLDYVKRKEEGDGTLQITAIRRAICTSDDALTQAHAVSNIFSLTDVDLLGRLAADEEFDARIAELCTSSYNRTLQLCGRDQKDLAAATCWLYRAAITHIFMSALNSDQKPTDEQSTRIRLYTFDIPSLSLSSDQMQNANPNMSIAYLGFMVLFTDIRRNRTQAGRLALRSAFDGLVNPSWQCISIITEIMVVLWKIHYRSEIPNGNEISQMLRQVQKAWVGQSSTVHQNLKALLQKSNNPHCEDRDILREYLVHIFNLAGKAGAYRGGDSSSRLAVAAGFLRFSEGLVRGKDSSSNLINAGRNLRPELISALQPECEKNGVFTSEETLDELIQLFTELTRLAPDHISDERPTRTLDRDDKELVYLFSPILQQLNAIMMKNARFGSDIPNTDRDYLEFRRQVEELKSIFANFEAVVKNNAARAREIKKRNRDPDLRWCYYYE